MEKADFEAAFARHEYGFLGKSTLESQACGFFVTREGKILYWPSKLSLGYELTESDNLWLRENKNRPKSLNVQDYIEQARLWSAAGVAFFSALSFANIPPLSDLFDMRNGIGWLTFALIVMLPFFKAQASLFRSEKFSKILNQRVNDQCQKLEKKLPDSLKIKTTLRTGKPLFYAGIIGVITFGLFIIWAIYAQLFLIETTFHIYLLILPTIYIFLALYKILLAEKTGLTWNDVWTYEDLVKYRLQTKSPDKPNDLPQTAP